MFNVTEHDTVRDMDVTTIGGKLVISDGAEVEGLPQAANQAESTATTVAALKADLNSLIAKLKSAGLMEADAE